MIPGCTELLPEDCGQSSGLRYQRLRAPDQDGEALVVPPFACVGELLARNLARRGERAVNILGLSLDELATAARREALAAARQYTFAYRAASPALAEGSPERIIAAGHQPELFHPGVWFKNFALSDLARIHQATPLNLVIDSDDARHVDINVPGGSVEQPVIRPISLDDPDPAALPFEERGIRNPERFRAFAQAVSDHLRPFVPDPLLRDFWPQAIERAEATGNLGAALAQARHLLEAELGLQTLELPQSLVCETDSFRRFAGHLICEAAQFAEAHNAALGAYRKINRVRSQAHPVPDLEQVDAWTETPFWIWSAEHPQRRSLYVSRQGSQLLLSNRDQIEFQLELGSAGEPDGDHVVAQLAELASRGIKLRTKALTTTMWARLALSDLFLHGIGGAKYDQLNDEIIRRFWGVDPPRFLTVSATFRLPITGWDEQSAAAWDENHVDENSLRGLKRELRELEFQPERHLSSGSANALEARALIAEKLQLITLSPPPGQDSKTRFARLAEINKQLRVHVAEKRSLLEEQLAHSRTQVRARRMLRSREFSFCLFPLDKIRGFLLEIRPDEP